MYGRQKMSPLPPTGGRRGMSTQALPDQGVDIPLSTCLGTILAVQPSDGIWAKGGGRPTGKKGQTRRTGNIRLIRIFSKEIRMQKRQGFTLIELMIVIAIIAIIAAIAIPGLLSSQRASNERNASASLKTIASAE